MQAKRQGFTLIELLTVIAIMAMLSTVAVTSYYSAIRGMTRRSALKHLGDTLNMARQRACLEGAPMCVMIFNETTGFTSDADAQNYGDTVTENTSDNRTYIPTFVICKQLGRVTCLPDGDASADGDLIVDEFTALDTMFGVVHERNARSWRNEHRLEMMRLYNMTKGKWSDVYPKAFYCDLENRCSSSQPRRDSGEKAKSTWNYQIGVFGFAIQQGNNVRWEINDSYGIEVSPPNSLPRGFTFDDLNGNDETDVELVTFYPDGTCTGERTIRIRETATNNRASISIDSSGTVSWSHGRNAWQ